MTHGSPIFPFGKKKTGIPETGPAFPGNLATQILQALICSFIHSFGKHLLGAQYVSEEIGKHESGVRHTRLNPLLPGRVLERAEL